MVPMKKYNEFNLDKMKKMSVAPVVLDQEDEGLKIVETNEDYVEDVNNLRSLISYKVEGMDAIRYVSENHMKNRISQIA
jgi:hypothetical protein